MAFGIVRVSGPKFFQWPGTGLNDIHIHVFVPFEGTADIAILVKRELRCAVVQKYYVMIAARAGVAAPFGTGITHEFIVHV